MFDVGDEIEVMGKTCTIVAEVDEGGFGAVFKGRLGGDIFGTDVALKVPMLDKHDDVYEMRERFKRECKIHANIDHDHVVRIKGVETLESGDLVLIQSFVEGAETFGEWKHKDEGELISVVLQALYALRAIHSQDGNGNATIHRDMSPNNVLVDRKGIARIIDFGLAVDQPREYTKLTEIGQWFGTMGCVSPEQMRGAGSVDHRTDLYGLGRSLAAKILGVLPVHVDLQALPHPWKDICEKLADEEVNRRFADANEAIDFVLGEVPKTGIAHIDVHQREINTWTTPPANWFPILRAYITLKVQAEDPSVLSLCMDLPDSFIKQPDFDLNDIFEQLNHEEGPIGLLFDGSGYIFEACDPLSDMLTKWYPYLSDACQAACFRRTCRVAVLYNRYYVMGKIREIYDLEERPERRKVLASILDEEDPDKIIYGCHRY